MRVASNVLEELNLEPGDFVQWTVREREDGGSEAVLTKVEIQVMPA